VHFGQRLASRGVLGVFSWKNKFVFLCDLTLFFCWYEALASTNSDKRVENHFCWYDILFFLHCIAESGENACFVR